MKIKEIVKKIELCIGAPTTDNYGNSVPANAVRIIKWNVTDPDMKLIEEIWEGGRSAFITPKGNPTMNLRRTVFGHPVTINSNAPYEFEIEPILMSEVHL